MSDLIRKLSEQAMEYAAEQYGPQRKGELVWNPYTYEMKFSELIIAECQLAVVSRVDCSAVEAIKERFSLQA